MKDFSFFLNTRKLLPDVSYNEIFQRITFKSYNKYKLVFREGEVGNRFFIILRGEVHVLVRKMRSELIEEDPKKKRLAMASQRKRKILTKATTLKFLGEDLYKMTAKEKILMRYPGYEYIRSLKTGESFGEIALTQTSRRTAAIVCAKNTDFLILSKFDYEDILSKVEQYLQNLKIKELSQFPFLEE